jgi:ribokinase
MRVLKSERGFQQSRIAKGIGMKILVFGSLNIDLTFSVDHIVKPGETIGSTALQRGAGGKGANQAAALAKAGMDVHMAGKIGADGEFLAGLLQSYGVNTDHIARYDGATGQAIIQLEKTGQNSILLFAGGNGRICSDEIETTLDAFGVGDAVLLQNEIVRTGEIMEQAKKRGMKIYLNPSPFDASIADLPLDIVDCFFVNEIEGAALARTDGAPLQEGLTDTLDGLVRCFPEAEIILTAGSCGAYYARSSLRAKGEIVKLPVVDTVGAGDTFTGFFIAARNRGHSVEEALQTACRAASISVSRKGAMEAMPRWDEL